ncbi:hypothetical protein LINGRAHAP2_LOCUS6619 [Linum grandiflorum]
MGEAFLDYELLQEGKFREVYDMAFLVSITDPFCPNIQQFLAIYGILLHHKANTSSVNCYNVLGIPSPASHHTIGLKFTTLKKLVSSARDPSPISRLTSFIAIAAEAANTLLNFAFQVLSNETSRRDYDSRCNLPPRTADNNEKKMPAIPLLHRLRNKRRCRTPTTTSGSLLRRCNPRRVLSEGRSIGMILSVQVEAAMVAA